MNGGDMDDRQTLGVSQSSRDISSPLWGKLLIDGHASVVKARRQARAGSPAEVVLASFERYLLAERALVTGTVRGYVTLDQPLPFLLWSDQLKY